MRIIFLSCFLVLFTLATGGVNARSAAPNLPKVMPFDVHMTYYENGGLTGSWRRIEIFEKRISFEIRETGADQTNSWNAVITRKESEAIYDAFVANKFDRIKNKKQ
ncbi:MAG: hypothetical protein KDB79_07645, partial [Acidobacteria bacterium]|nr:hypothetical protein [Acidobacteriota bacterium]